MHISTSTGTNTRKQIRTGEINNTSTNNSISITTNTSTSTTTGHKGENNMQNPKSMNFQQQQHLLGAETPQIRQSQQGHPCQRA